MIGHRDIQLAPSSILIEFRSIKTQKSIHTNSNRRLLLMVPVICSMAFAAFSDVAGTPETHQAVNFQSAVVEEPQTGDNVTIGPRTYNSETLNFERPWPLVRNPIRSNRKSVRQQRIQAGASRQTLPASLRAVDERLGDFQATLRSKNIFNPRHCCHGTRKTNRRDCQHSHVP